MKMVDGRHAAARLSLVADDVVTDPECTGYMLPPDCDSLGDHPQGSLYVQATRCRIESKITSR